MKVAFGFTTFSLHERGFTLIELLVTISIIAILAVIGSTLFNNVQTQANDSTRKSDVLAISKAFESNYDPVSGRYDATKILSGVAFASGQTPTPPEGGEYFADLEGDNGSLPRTGRAFRVCAILSDNTSFCKDSQQGAYNENPPLPLFLMGTAPGSPTPTPTNSPGPTNTPTPTPFVPLSSGTATELGVPLSCGSGCTEHTINLDCQGIPTRQAKVREYLYTSPKRGTIVYTTGGYGIVFYSQLTYVGQTPSNNPALTMQQMATTPFGAGNGSFKQYEISWQGAKGWLTNASGFGIKKAMCGYSAIVKWIYQREENSPSGVFCAQGNSAGGMQITYGMTYYDLKSIYDMVIVGGGPPPSKLDIGCFGGDPTYQDGTFLQNPGFFNERSTIFDFAEGWQSAGDYCMNGFGQMASTPESVVNQARDDSLVSTTQPGEYAYSTKVNFIQGAIDPYRFQGNFYYNAITTTKSTQTTTTYPDDTWLSHRVDEYSDGADRIRSIFINECQN